MSHKCNINESKHNKEKFKHVRFSENRKNENIHNVSEMDGNIQYLKERKISMNRINNHRLS